MLDPAPNLIVDSQDTVWRGRFHLDVITFRQLRFDGTWSGPRQWELWCRGRAAALLPYDPVADMVLLIEQYRLPAHAAGFDPIMLEVPAGLCDGEEPPEATIRREAIEEARLNVQELQKIGDFLLSPGASDERVTLFVGRIDSPPADAAGIVGYGGLAGEQEDIRIRLQPALQAIEAALEGRIANATTAIALLWLAVRRSELRVKWGKAAGTLLA
jgi:ADP-ribose pyrophosphatase